MNDFTRNQGKERDEEIKKYVKATDVLWNILIRRNEHAKELLKTEEGDRETKLKFDGKIGENVTFTGHEKTNSFYSLHKSQEKLKAQMFVNREGLKQPEHLCNIYRRIIFDYGKPTLPLKERIVIETPSCQKSNHVNTRFEGVNDARGNVNVLNVIHAPEEDPSEFIKNLHETVCANKKLKKTSLCNTVKELIDMDLLMK